MRALQAPWAAVAGASRLVQPQPFLRGRGSCNARTSPEASLLVCGISAAGVVDGSVMLAASLRALQRACGC